MSGSIVIKGAREHNLKNIDVEIPRDAPVNYDFSAQRFAVTMGPKRFETVRSWDDEEKPR